MKPISRRSLLAAGGMAAAGVATGLGLRHAKANSSGYLRPPGASGEDDFLARCIRCQQCVQVCPTSVLKSAGAQSGISFATPYVVAREIPCDLCQGRDQMECIAVCPTDALAPLPDRRDVRMGVAVINPDICLPFLGCSCKSCWHACPFAREAFSFDGLGRPIVVKKNCVGCGLCEHACPTEPAAIVIKASK